MNRFWRENLSETQCEKGDIHCSVGMSLDIQLKFNTDLIRSINRN